MRSPPPSGAPVPLFDRLEDHAPLEAVELRPLRTLSQEGLLVSLQRELQALLNTRCPRPRVALGGGGQSVLDYGLPELPHFAPADFASRGDLERLIAATIEAFEPRLTGVVVGLTPHPGDPQALAAHIDAALAPGLGGGRIDLRLRLGGEGGAAAFAAAVSGS